MKSKLLILVVLIGIITFSCTKPYKDKSLSPEQRVEDLVARLTLEEKMDLMMDDSKAIPRLGIKKYAWWNEALHGVARNGTATVFPQTIGMAASFDVDLVHEVFSTVSDEARVKNRLAREKGDIERYSGLTMWTPNINIFRDPRWGRGQETYGEDPYLTGLMGVEVIKGLQGDPINGIDKLHACAKHFAVHSGPEWNRHSFNAENISQRDLWETYLPAFKAAVQKGKVKEVMCAYNRYEGEPCCSSDKLLIDILRSQWGYEGIVLSDCGAIRDFYLPNWHLTHPDAEHATADAILSGTDLECGSSYKAIVKAVEEGLITDADIDVSLKRLLIARYKLGEMDGTSPWDSLPDNLVCNEEHKQLALTMARESMVLLKNNGVLPLKKNISVALLGPNADDADMQMGNYNGTPLHTITLREALTNLLSEKNVLYDRVSDHTGTTESIFDQCSYNNRPGFYGLFWDNLEQKGEPGAKLQFEEPIKVGKRDTISPEIPLEGTSALYQSTLVPAESGFVNFVFVTKSKLELTVNGNPVKLNPIKMEIQAAGMNVIAGEKYEIELKQVTKEKGQFKFDIRRNVQPDMSKILKAVANKDVVVFAGGINSHLEREEGNVFAPGFEGGDRSDIELPKVQRDVIAALKKAGKKVILVNFSGSAMGLVPESKNCDAIIQAWYPGESGGQAVVDVLFGDYNPSGKLPVTFYKSVKQLPDFQDYNMQGRTYRYMKESPLYPFGYGLSYTKFDFGNVEVDKKSITTDDTLLLSVTVSNTGQMDGSDVVQVYLRKKNDEGGPEKTLRAFKRVDIPTGKSTNVIFELTNENLEWWDEATQTVCMHPGDYQLMVGNSSGSKDLQTVEFSVK